MNFFVSLISVLLNQTIFNKRFKASFSLFIVAISLLTFVSFLSYNLPIFAQNNAQNNQSQSGKYLTQKESRLKTEIERISANVNLVTKSLNESQGQTTQLSQQLESLNQEIKTTNQLLEDTREVIRQIDIGINQKQKEYDRIEVMLVGILRDVSMAQKQGVAQTFLTSKNIGEAVSKLYQFTQLASQTDNLREDLAKVKSQLENQKADQENAKNVLQDTKALQQSKQDSLKILLKQTENSQTRYEELLKALGVQEIQKAREIQSIQEEKKGGQEIGQNPGDTNCLVNAETKPIAVPSGYFVRPMEGKISQYFGCNSDSIHDGVDIAAGIGTPVYASATGKIVKKRTGCINGLDAWCNGGLGNYVVIQHDLPSGDRVWTVYAHLTSVEQIEENFSVSQKALLGYNGCTGNTYPRPCGPHLHFSIIANSIDVVNCNRMYGATNTTCYDPSNPPFDIF